VHINDTGEEIVVANFFVSVANEIQRVVFADGTIWDAATLRQMATVINGTSAANTLTGTAGNDNINGLGGNDIIDGLDGNDVIDGGTGNDTMRGGLGDDTYTVDSTTDVVTENASAGTDTVKTTVTLTLATNVENLILLGTGNINGTGNTLANVLIGNAGNNTLSGGTGADQMRGGAGNDIYTVDNVGDTVTENVNEGTDLVNSTVTFTIGANIENITLTGSAAINATGNALNNTLTGTSGVNVLTGGQGNDNYFVTAGDTVVELLDEGIDTVSSAVTFTLANHVENLTLTGSTAVNGTGNGLNNVMTGNSANNQLSGGFGDDIYIITSGDTVTEALNAGMDQVQVGATHTLALNVDALLLTGTTAINGTGNALNNLITGNSANNTLSGGAGTNGNDVLQGMAGNDTMSDTVGKNLFDGGAGTDTMTGGTANEFFAGGAGNDTITTGTGADIIAFNRNDGADTVAVSTGADNTISIGGGVTYADMRFAKSGNNLILKLGGTDQITLTNWYAATTNKSVLTLQTVAEAMAGFNPASTDPLLNKKVTQFNFQGLVTAFDQALVQTPGLTDWALTNAITSFQLAGSDTEALGGDLAYWYGKNGNFATLGVQPVQDILGAANFGSGQQTLQPPRPCRQAWYEWRNEACAFHCSAFKRAVECAALFHPT
jgi:Ca2+-binding RTX toxin-like protein